MVNYYILCALVIGLFIYYLVKSFVDLGIGFVSEITKKYTETLKEAYGNMENYAAHVHKEALFRHIIFTIILGIIFLWIIG